MAASGKPSKPATAEAAVAAAETALYRAMVAADMDALDGLLADGLAYIHSNGVRETRRQFLARVRQGFYRYERIRGRRVDTTLAGGLAVRCGRLAMAVATDGGPVLTVNLHQTLVWRRHGRAWKLLLRQATRIP